MNHRPGSTVELVSIWFTTCILVLVTVSGPVVAQSFDWDQPTEFFRVTEAGDLQSPTLLLDAFGVAHAFWSASPDDARYALYYSFWDSPVWSSPIDVLASADGDDLYPFILQEDDGKLFVFWLTGRGIMYSSCSLDQLDNAHAWLPPELIPTSRQAWAGLGVARDPVGQWHFVYASRQLDSIRTMTCSEDLNSCAPETAVATAPTDDTWLAYPGITAAPNGDIWLWWHELDPKGTGFGHQRAVYVRSASLGRDWSAQVGLAEGYYAANFEVREGIMVRTVVGGTGTGGRYISFSYDSGESWTEARNIGAGAGEGMQAVRIAVDSTGTWHFVVEASMNFATISKFSDGTWSKPAFIASASLIESCCHTPGTTTENATIVVSDGNQLHLFFEEANRTIWTTSRQLPAPRISASGNPTVNAESRVSQALPTPEIPALSALPGGDLSVTRSVDGEIVPATTPVLLGLLPVLLLICVVIVIKRGGK